MRPTSQFNTFTISEASKIIGNIPATKKHTCILSFESFCLYFTITQDTLSLFDCFSCIFL